VTVRLIGDVMRTKMIESGEVRNLFEQFPKDCPFVDVRIDRDSNNVDFEVKIPMQPGIEFEINLNWQGDELYLSAGGF
jgi:hypothetical protein